MIETAVSTKPEGITFEVSGGIRLNTMDKFLIKGVDALSIGALTYAAPQVDVQ
jgi:nicotinate-nucleotide pyrophosphorylase (carboxylating)